jgi:hypothetical protein
MARQVNWTTKLQDYNFMIKHVEGTNNTRAGTLSRPDGVEKSEKKTATLLLDTYFVGLIAGREEEEETLTREDKAEAIQQSHDVPMAGHPGIKRTLNLLTRRGQKWKGM